MDIESIIDRANSLVKKTKDYSEVSADRTSVLKVAEEMSTRGYIHTAESIKAIDAILCGYGVLLSGNVGVGKSFFFDCIKSHFPTIKLNMNEAFLWDYESLKQFLIATNEQALLIDDVRGDTARDFGRTFDPMMIILEHRAGVKKRTHITTNLDNQGLIDKLDYRVVDRIYGMMMPIRFEHQTSFRKPKRYVN